MTNEEWMKEAERLAMQFAHCYAFVGDDTMPKAKAALLAHLQQRPLTGEEAPSIDRDGDGELLIDWSPKAGRMLTLSLRADGRLSYAFLWDGEKAHGTAQMPPGARPLTGKERCPHCDDTGDVTRADGEWLGFCRCPAGLVANLRYESNRLTAWTNSPLDGLLAAAANEIESPSLPVRAEPKRYSWDCDLDVMTGPVPDGEWVRYADVFAASPSTDREGAAPRDGVLGTDGGRQG